MKPYSIVSMHKRFEQNQKPKISIPIQVTKPKEQSTKDNSWFNAINSIWNWFKSFLVSPPQVFMPAGNPFFFKKSESVSISNKIKLDMIRHGRWHGAKGKSRRIQMQGGI